jgi:CubicO group peptidase (beta-lactamase class C family)
VRVDRGADVVFEQAYGPAHRAWDIPNTVDTRFGIASGTKGLTALTVMRAIERGQLEFSTMARSVLGTDLPLVDDSVTVEQLLAHRSGIGDFLDEDENELDDYVLTVPVHEIATTEDYLAVLDGHPQVSAPDERFTYNNGGYVVLALIVERVSGTPFSELVRGGVCEPAGMENTEFLRSDTLPGGVALGYLTPDADSRSNVLHLPVRGTGDGGIFTTVADVSAFWTALFAGRIVSAASVAEMVRPRSDAPAESLRYGLGFWIHESSDVVELHGCDAGVSFRSVHDPSTRLTHTVVSNTTDGAWPITRLLDRELDL